MTHPTFYVDETYGPRLVTLLREMNLHAVTYRDVPGIESGDRDVDWIPNVAARGWIAYGCVRSMCWVRSIERSGPPAGGR